jgi:asparagine synthase (glutamine-hydrolysing)
MCGITGFYSKNLFTFNNVILKMNSALFHRGPDFAGVWQDKSSGIVFGHQRLSILDLSSAGNQPMISSSGRFVITYNGEIYNHLEVRKELNEMNLSINWKSNSDTETFLEAIENLGIDSALKKVVGMFAFALWDKKKCSLTLARDRMGEKPLYYGWQGQNPTKTFLFSSELKSLKQHPAFEGEINRNAIALQLRHNCIPDPYSIYKNIFKLPPGHYLEFKENDLKNNLTPKPSVYWSLKKCAIDGKNNQINQSDLEIQKELERYLKLSVKQQMLSDVPVGAFLSGGIDSSTIVSLMQEQSTKPIKTFAIGFNEAQFNEAQHAKKIARYLNTDHTELYFSPKMAMNEIPNLPDIYDEPFSDNSQIPSILLSRLAKNQVTVALSGDGADELFLGYNRYHSINNLFKNLNLLPRSIKKFFEKRIKSISNKNWNKLFEPLPFFKKYKNHIYKTKFLNILQNKNLLELYFVLCSHWQNPDQVVINSKEPDTFYNDLDIVLHNLENFDKMMYIDQSTYMPNDILVKVDRASMASSLEIRIPFLNHKLIEYAWKIPNTLKSKNSKGKWILREILKNYIPDHLTNRPKMGFGIPLDTWLRGPLRDWAENLLNGTKLSQGGFLNKELVRNKWEDFISKKSNFQYDLWNILMFQAWLDRNK